MGIFRLMTHQSRCLTRHNVFFLCCLALVLFLVAGCGKSGMPLPKKTQDTFTITGASLSPMGDCVVARGTVTGAANLIDKLVLEMAPIESYDDCPGCPFVAREFMEYSSSDIQLDPTGQFLLSFCPATDAPMYRWRLVGKNVFLGLPHTTTTPQVMMK